MQWLTLIVSGIMEVSCIISLKYAEGFTKIPPLITYTLFGFLSAFLFPTSLKFIPLGSYQRIFTNKLFIPVKLHFSFDYRKIEYPITLLDLIFLFEH